MYGTGPDDPQANLAVRVRRPIDDRLGDIVYQLRPQGVRTSKAELIELLVWTYVPDQPTDNFRAVLAPFRQRVPRAG